VSDPPGRSLKSEYRFHRLASFFQAAKFDTWHGVTLCLKKRRSNRNFAFFEATNLL
jgi:hypothetical protein